MNAKRLWFVVLAAAMSSAAQAAAQESDPSDESDAPRVDDTSPPPGDAPPEGAPPEAGSVPPPALASEPGADASFGFAGQITISDDLQLVATRTSTNGEPGHLNRIQLHPAVDFFPVPNLSIGGQVIIEYDSIDTDEYDSVVALGLLARLGYNIQFSPTVSLWPRVAIGYRHVSGAMSPGPSDSSVSSAPFQLYLPVVVQLAPHFFVGGGPIWSTNLYYKWEGVDDPATSTVGLQSTLGGYFKGL